MKLLLVLVMLLPGLFCFGQKPALTIADTKNWISVSGGQLSHDGQFVGYNVYGQPRGSVTLVIQSTSSDWKKEFIGASDLVFSPDSRLAQFRVKDSFAVLTLGREELLYSANRSQFDVRPGIVPESLVNEISNKIKQLGDDFELASRKPEWSNDSRYVFFWIQSGFSAKAKTDAVKLNVWSYQDDVMQNRQLQDINKKLAYAAVIDTLTKRIRRIEDVNEKIIETGARYILLQKRLGIDGVFEAGWNKAAQLSYYIFSLLDGSKKLIKDQVINLSESPRMSPNGSWLVWFSFKHNAYYSYACSSGETRCITQGMEQKWTDNENDQPEPALPRGPLWLSDEKGIIAYDDYDIWLLDPSGKNAPRNLTNGYGAKHKIRFGLLDNVSALQSYKSTTGQLMLLTAMDEKRSSAFYQIRIGENTDPHLLSAGDYLFNSFSRTYIPVPVKAKNADIYLGMRCSATEAPNYFVTKDFKHFHFLSNVQPQKKYNWYTTELIKWQSVSGKSLKGILYKPENFDSTKKYPLIFQYYEKRSEELNLFIHPEASRSRLNIPVFVSNGYLIFVPDISYTLGRPGRSSLDAVVSAANYLKTKNWIDWKKMGLQGHSFGGFETAYIISRTNLFAAACAAAGVYDFVSKYTSGIRANFPIYHAERTQGRLGKTLWQAPGDYMANSPLLKADRITTPLLMMHNKGDLQVPFSQGIQFFTALRRLGKRAWMLEYENGDHSVNNGQDAEDYHTRMLQFFDHYLKDSAAPRWMLHGIPAKDKGIDDGLELIREKDPKTGKWPTPKEGGILTDEEKKKIDELKNKKAVSLKIE